MGFDLKVIVEGEVSTVYEEKECKIQTCLYIVGEVRDARLPIRTEDVHVGIQGGYLSGHQYAHGIVADRKYWLPLPLYIKLATLPCLQNT